MAKKEPKTPAAAKPAAVATESQPAAQAAPVPTAVEAAPVPQPTPKESTVTTETKAKSANEAVKMLNGTVVEFTPKQRLKKSSITAENGDLQVRLDFRNGESRLFTIRPDMLAKFALHGAEQKLGDEISNVEKIDDAVEAIDQLMQRLDNGDWTKEREGGSGLAGASVLTKALVEFTKTPVQQVRDYLAKLDAKTKTALRNSAEIQPIIKRLEAEAEARAAARGAATPAIDVAGVLAGLKAAPVNSVFPPAPV